MFEHAFRVIAAAASDTGKRRSNNEDSWLIHSGKAKGPGGESYHVFAVADGIGGAAAGEVASQLAVATLKEQSDHLTKEDTLKELEWIVNQAHTEINQQALAKPELTGMGSTFTALFMKGSQASLAQVGDSRAYLIRDGEIIQLTKDQTVVADLMARGLINPSEANTHPQRHVLLQALGGGREAPEPDLLSQPIEMDDVIVMCSDGLYNLVNDGEIQNAALTLKPRLAAERLVHLANQRGGTDNITVIIIRILPPPYWVSPIEIYRHARDRLQMRKRKLIS